MKPRHGSFLSESDYQQQLDAAIRLFQRRVASPFKTQKLPNTAQIIWSLFRAHEPNPLTRGDIAKLLHPAYEGFDAYAWKQINHHVHSRLQLLLNRGLIYPVVRVIDPYFTKTKSPPSTWSYRATEEGQANVIRHQRARAALYKTVERLNRQHDQSAALMASAVPMDARDDRMLVLRAKGWTLREIGLEYGLTRERVRQILAKTYQPVERSRASAREAPHG